MITTGGALAIAGLIAATTLFAAGDVGMSK